MRILMSARAGRKCGEVYFTQQKLINGFTRLGLMYTFNDRQRGANIFHSKSVA